MKKFLNIFIFIFILINTNIFGVEFIKQSNNLSDFIPRDWKIIDLVEGDLNKDGLTDAVIIIEDTNFLNFSKVENWGQEYPLEPRAILILFRNKNGKYTLVSKNNNGFITSNYSYIESNKPYENAKINKNNTLTLNFRDENGLGIGTLAGVTLSYIFRWQNNSFELIGFESGQSYKKIAVDSVLSYDISVNFSTNKAKITTIYYEDIENENIKKPDEVEWKNIKFSKKFILDELKTDIEDEIISSILEYNY